MPSNHNKSKGGRQKRQSAASHCRQLRTKRDMRGLCKNFTTIQARRGVTNNKAHIRVHIEIETVAATVAEN